MPNILSLLRSMGDETGPVSFKSEFCLTGSAVVVCICCLVDGGVSFILIFIMRITGTHNGLVRYERSLTLMVLGGDIGPGYLYRA